MDSKSKTIPPYSLFQKEEEEEEENEKVFPVKDNTKHEETS